MVRVGDTTAIIMYDQSLHFSNKYDLGGGTSILCREGVFRKQAVCERALRRRLNIPRNSNMRTQFDHGLNDCWKLVARLEDLKMCSL